MSDENLATLKDGSTSSNNQGVVDGMVEEDQFISLEDKHLIETASLKKEIALSAARLSLAQSENADLSHKYTILQVYIKYGLTANDTIVDGKIVKNGNVK